MSASPRTRRSPAAHADAFVIAYLPGSKGGTAIADVLFGRVAERGKLPFSGRRASATCR